MFLNYAYTIILTKLIKIFYNDTLNIQLVRYQRRGMPTLPVVSLMVSPALPSECLSKTNNYNLIRKVLLWQWEPEVKPKE